MLTRRRALAVLALAVSATVPASAKDEAWKDKLLGEILSRYPAQKGGSAGLKGNSPGGELILQTDGVLAETIDVGVDRPVAKYPVTPIRDGQVMAVGSGSSGGGFSRGENVGKRLAKGDRVRLISAQINDKKPKLISTRDSLSFRCENTDCVVLYFEMDPQTIQDRGTTTQVAFRGVMRFEFPVGYLETAPVADVFAALNRVVKSPDELAQEPAPTVKLGQTAAEVQQILGKPERIMDLGTKKIFVYKDMKVVFLDGKVSDVQ